MRNMKEGQSGFQAIARPRLESIRMLLDFLGAPEKALNYIHVAGTNGKGSVCAFLQGMFTDAGYKTGKYTSPHLMRVNERITVDGCEIGDGALRDVMAQVESAAGCVKQALGEMPTQFEIWTAAALCYFKAYGCDIVIMETGLGGARDATNVIPPPKAAVITRIAADHAEYLGDTLSEIAAAKAGIIKKNGTAGYTVTLQQEDEVMPVLEQACKRCENRLVLAKQPILRGFCGMYERFDYDGMEQLELGLAGLHQVENAVLAIETARICGISEQSIRKGLKQAKNPARLERLSACPPVIFDGAHNRNGMRALAENLDRYYPGVERTFIMGCMRDKDVAGMLEELAGGPVKRLLAVKVPGSPRAMEAERLAELARKAGIRAQAFPDAAGAYRAALEDDGVVVLCGSLYLYEAFWNIIKKRCD